MINKKNLFWILVIVLFIALLASGNSEKSSNNLYSSGNYYSGSQGGNESDLTISRDEAVSEYWGEIKEYLSGSETIEACSSESGNCYDLDADISNGEVEEIYFPNQGYLYFSADIDENGYASDFDKDSNEWDFSLDMDSSLVDNAIQDWADNNGYIIE